MDFEIDASAFTAAITALADSIDQTDHNAALKVGFEVMRLSQQQVPHDKGSLQNSGAVEVIDGDVYVGYHSVYAARLHEHPEYRFGKGRKGKYLTDPIIDNADVLGLVYGKTFEDNIK